MNHCSKSSILIPSILGLIFVIVGLRHEVVTWFAELKQFDMCEFLENSHTCLLWLYIVLTTTLLAVILSQLYKHNESLKSLNKQIAKIKHISSFTYEVKNIERYVRIIAYIALAFCLGAVIHYLAIGLPRVVKAKADGHVYDLGVDYLGLIVAIFAIIVTLLVTWQIYSTIKAKEELREIKEDIENDFEKRLSELEKCCNDGRNKLINLDKTNEANNKRLVTIESDLNHKTEFLDKKVFKLSLRNDGAVTSALNIDTCFELLGLMTLHSKKCQMRGKEPRFKKAQRDIIYILEDFKDRGEFISCKESEFKSYATITKRLNIDWMKKYLISFKVFDNNMKERLTSQEKEKLFDEA